MRNDTWNMIDGFRDSFLPRKWFDDKIFNTFDVEM